MLNLLGSQHLSLGATATRGFREAGKPGIPAPEPRNFRASPVPRGSATPLLSPRDDPLLGRSAPQLPSGPESGKPRHPDVEMPRCVLPLRKSGGAADQYHAQGGDP